MLRRCASRNDERGRATRPAGFAMRGRSVGAFIMRINTMILRKLRVIFISLKKGGPCGSPFFSVLYWLALVSGEGIIGINGWK